MKKSILIGILLVINFCFSQEKIPLVDLDKIDELTSKYSKEGAYDKAIETLNKVSKNDSTYCATLLSKSYYLIQLKKYDESIKVIDEGLKINCIETNLNFYNNKTVSYLNVKKYAEAIQTINQGLKIYPNNYKLWYNKGVALENQKKLKEAIVAYQKTILLKPLYRKPHLQLGNICYKQEKMAQALMCFNMYLLLNPDADDSFSVLKSLNNIVANKNVNTADIDFVISDDDESFEDIDLVLNQKVALNKNYNTGNKINISLVKQNHALLEQLKDYTGNGGFWDHKYVPFYKWINENGYFDDFTHTLVYSIENEEYKKIVKKNKDKIVSFVDLSRIKWKDILKENIQLIDGKEQKITNYYHGSYLQAIGKMENNVTVGHWTLYNESGQLTGKGRFNTEGKKEGKWTWFYDSGKIKETAFYKNDTLDGENSHYFKNGRTYIITNYSNGTLKGKYKLYNDKGALIQNKVFKNDKLEGMYISYFNVGKELPEFHVSYKNGLIEGEFTEYYANGDVYMETNYTKGDKIGVEKKYHANKQLYSETNYLNGKLNGVYRTFHSNGKPQEVGQCSEGLYDGNWKSYYYDGTLESEFTRDKGQLDGLYKNYDSDGKIHYQYNYRKDEIISYTFYDKQGAIIKENRKKGGEFFYTGYSPLGNITSEGLYDISGGKKGKWKFFNANGVLYGEGNYSDNKAQGEYLIYYQNGQKESITFYKDDVSEAYYVDYYKTGQMETQGWYKNGEQHGEWRSYYEDGSLQSIYYYHNGKFHNNQEEYAVNGSLSNIYNYIYGELITDAVYNNDGSLFETINFQQEDNSYQLAYNYSNGNQMSVFTYVNGIKHGPYSNFDYYGKKVISGAYLNDSQDGTWTWYYDNGAVESVRKYVNGQLHGESIDYFKDGKLQNKYYYSNGNMTGNWLSYNEDGTLETSTVYEWDKKHGKKEFYSPTGKLQIIRFYNHGRLIGYSYLDKNSKEMPMIKLTNETGILKAYFDNGKVSREMEFINGELVNKYKAYYYSGQLENETNYKDDEYDGLSVEYHPNGTIKKQSAYLNGSLHGTQKEYYENGNLKKGTIFLNDTENGDSTFYNEHGKLIKKESYFNGTIFASKIY